MKFPSTSTDDKHDFLMSKIRDEVRNSSSRNVSNIKRGHFRYRCPFFEARCIAISKVSVTYTSISNENDKDFSLK